MDELFYIWLWSSSREWESLKLHTTGLLARYVALARKLIRAARKQERAPDGFARWSALDSISHKRPSIHSTIEPSGLPPDRFVLAAAHTHHSPGNYMTSRIPFDLAAFEGGYDPDLFYWFARQIADTIKEAAKGARRRAIDPER